MPMRLLRGPPPLRWQLSQRFPDSLYDGGRRLVWRELDSVTLNTKSFTPSADPSYATSSSSSGARRR